ncbi:hypothetical protein, partial [Microcoleus sp. N9_A1]|uniref:hypothetical protein n=1 Tax=Microcoleus sp. N9_A1 TaxID=3055380 RepID=UPI002FD20FDD
PPSLWRFINILISQGVVKLFGKLFLSFFLNLYTPRVSAALHCSDLRWLTPLLTMGSFFGPT